MVGPDDHLAPSPSMVGPMGSLLSMVSMASEPVLPLPTSADVQDDETAEKDDGLATGTADQYIKDAIPLLPLPVAVLFFLCNVVVPGLGQYLGHRRPRARSVPSQ